MVDSLSAFYDNKRLNSIRKKCRPVAPTVERRSPKPNVVGSNPTGPAINLLNLIIEGLLLIFQIH